MIVDTSNEIGGDGDVPHPGIGRCPPNPGALSRASARVMIEAVENHMPEVVVIDEIGTEARGPRGAHHRRARGAADRDGARHHSGEPDRQPDAVRSGRRDPDGHLRRRRGAPAPYAQDRVGTKGTADFRGRRRDPRPRSVCGSPQRRGRGRRDSARPVTGCRVAGAASGRRRPHRGSSGAGTRAGSSCTSERDQALPLRSSRGIESSGRSATSRCRRRSSTRSLRPT